MFQISISMCPRETRGEVSELRTSLVTAREGHTDTVTRAVVNRLWHGEVFFFLFSRRQGQNWRVSDSVLC